MRARTTILFILVLTGGLLALADVFGPRTVEKKVAEAELIVQGVATLEGLPIPPTAEPFQTSCKIVVLKTLWPTNQPATNTITVSYWAWTNWPDSWWNYNSQTGVYFFVRTKTELEKFRAKMKRENPRLLPKIDDNILGTNMWMPLPRFADWYEPATNAATIQRLMEKSKK